MSNSTMLGDVDYSEMNFMYHQSITNQLHSPYMHIYILYWLAPSGLFRVNVAIKIKKSQEAKNMTIINKKPN